MAVLELPTPGLPWSRFRVTLDGELFHLELRWNGKAAAYYLDLYDGELAPLARGIRLVSGVPLLLQHAGQLGFPKGALMAMDTEPVGADAELDTLGDRVRLYYVEAA